MPGLFNRVRKLEEGPRREVIILHLDDGSTYQFFGTPQEFTLVAFSELRKGGGRLVTACAKTKSFEASDRRLVGFIVSQAQGNEDALMDLLCGVPKTPDESAESIH